MNATCGIYARYSSEKQNANSVEDQIRKCREHATKNGWTVLENHIYRDAAISGASDNRDGLKRMLAAASVHPPAFSCLLVDDSSRLSRSVGDADRIVKELRFAGVKICYVAQGFDSESESAGLLTAVFGGINEQYLVDLGKKNLSGRRGLGTATIAHWGTLFRVQERSH